MCVCTCVCVCVDSPHDVIVIDVYGDVLEFVGNVKVVLFSPEWLKCLEGCSCPVCV